MNEDNPDKSGLVQKEILHFVQNDRLPYIVVDTALMVVFAIITVSLS